MALQVERLRKKHGSAKILNDVSFALEKGHCLALLGPSGCGKSTLLNILAGLLPSDGGRVLLDGNVIEDAEAGIALPARKRRFAMVFQDLSLWPHLTVEQNVGFGLDYLDLGKESKRQRIDEVLRMVGMENYQRRLPSTLSGGQQQRVAIARAIVVQPAVLLMDEPLAALDTKLREELREEIAAIIRRLEMTTVYVTHDHAEAMTVAHQVAVMHQGQLEQIAPPQEIFRTPATTIVAEFLGGTNHFRLSETLRAMRDSAGRPIFPDSSERGNFIVVAREAVRIVSGDSGLRGADGLVHWNAEVVKNRFAGGRNEVHAITAEGEPVRGFTAEPIAVGSTVGVVFDPRDAAYLER